MKWTKNNKACLGTWSALLILDQSTKSFVNSADVKIGKFKMWVPSDTSHLRGIRAKSLATMIDNVFEMLHGAKYEAGVTRPDAISALKGVLVDDEKTIAELASVVDDTYRFIGEIKP